MIRLDFQQGSLQNTGRQLDLGISGEGLFKIKISDSVGDGYGYTRNGNLFVNNSGVLVLQQWRAAILKVIDDRR